LTNSPACAIIKAQKEKEKEIKKMTNTEYKEMLKRKLEELQKQGKNPHGLMRDLLIDLELDELSE
jgi:molybdopterin synthase catalytic subunit